MRITCGLFSSLQHVPLLIRRKWLDSWRSLFLSSFGWWHVNCNLKGTEFLQLIHLNLLWNAFLLTTCVKSDWVHIASDVSQNSTILSQTWFVWKSQEISRRTNSQGRRGERECSWPESAWWWSASSCCYLIGWVWTESQSKASLSIVSEPFCKINMFLLVSLEGI